MLPLFMSVFAFFVFISCCSHALEVAKRPLVMAVYHANRDVKSERYQVCHNGSVFIGNGFSLVDSFGSSPSMGGIGVAGYGSNDRPLIGAFPVGTEAYHEWQLNVAKIAGIDGFLIEWGYPDTNSSADKTIAVFRRLLGKLNNRHSDSFSVVPLWLPNFSWAGNKNKLLRPDMRKGLISDMYITKFKGMINGAYHESGVYFNGKPLLFMLDFGLYTNPVTGLNGQELQELFDAHALPEFNLVMRMSENIEEHWETSTISRIVGSIPWLPKRLKTAGNAQSSFVKANFDVYGDWSSVESHIDKLNNLNAKFSDYLDLKIHSITPGVDTRYASWSRNCSVIQRSQSDGVNIYTSSWKKILFGKSSVPSITVIETFNDFSEGTHIEPSILYGVDYVLETAVRSCELKGLARFDLAVCQKRKREAYDLLCQAEKVFKARQVVNKIAYVDTSLGVGSVVNKVVDAWSRSVFNGDIYRSKHYEKLFFKRVDKLELSYGQSVFPVAAKDIGGGSWTLNMEEQGLSEFVDRDGLREYIDVELVVTLSGYDKGGKLILYQGEVELGRVYVSGGEKLKKLVLPLNRARIFNEGVLYEEYKIKVENADVELHRLRVERFFHGRPGEMAKFLSREITCDSMQGGFH